MLLTHQRKAANYIGITIGLIALAVVLFSNAPSGASPTLGTKIDVTARPDRQITPIPTSPATILATDDLQPGAPPVEGVVALSSRRADTASVRLELDEGTKALVPRLPFANVIELSFGHEGEYGTTTLAQMVSSAPSIPIRPDETIKVPLAVSLPLAAGGQAAGQKVSIVLVPSIDEGQR